MVASVMFADVDRAGMRFTREAAKLVNVTSLGLGDQTLYSSSDLAGQYRGVCPWFDNCALLSGRKTCANNTVLQDGVLDFSGQVGRVYAYDSKPVTPGAHRTNRCVSVLCV